MVRKGKDYNILLVGNNPSELANFYMNLSKFTKMSFLTDVCFDLKESITLALKKRPSYILLDDSYSQKNLRKFVYKIRNNNKTQDIPVGILKTSNRSQILVNGIQDFFLKDNFNAERLFYALSNSRKVRRAQIILYKAYKRSRKQYQLLLDRFRNFTESITF